MAVLVYNGVFDSGLAAVLDVLDGANAMGEEISEPPTWNVTTVGFEPPVRTGAGHLVATKPLAFAETVANGARRKENARHRLRSAVEMRLTAKNQAADSCGVASDNVQYARRSSRSRRFNEADNSALSPAIERPYDGRRSR